MIVPTRATVGELRASGYCQKTLRLEIRENLMASLREGRDPWPGLHGFESTVIPQLERALIAGHDTVLLGGRGQGKTFPSVVDTTRTLHDPHTLAGVGVVVRARFRDPGVTRFRRFRTFASDGST